MANEKPAHVQRMLDEYKELEMRIDKLEEFVGNQRWAAMEEIDRQLLISQLTAMKCYATSLSLRLDRA